MKIIVIAPVVLTGVKPDSASQYVQAAPPGCEVEVVYLERGPVSIESEFDECLATPGILARAEQAAAQGADALVISCILDPGLAAVREKVSIPVLGPGQVSMHLASILGHRFSVVTVVEQLIPILYQRARTYGLTEHLASVRTIDVPVLALWEDRSRIEGLLATSATKAIEEDGADAIVLGCTGLAGTAKAVRRALGQQGYQVPVIDPAITSIKLATTLLDAGLAHSKLAYPTPPDKMVFGYPELKT